WNDPARTAQSLRNGWWSTGDVGFLDADRRLHVLDRRADLLRRNGRVVYARPIEEALSDHPAVKEAHAVQLPGSESIWAAVSLRQAQRGRANAAALSRELLGFAAERLDPAGRPDEVEVFAGDLPRSIQQKVLKREVRDALAVGRRA